MILMRFRELTSCAEHRQVVIVLEEAGGDRTLAIAADPEETPRLVRELSRGPGDDHPIYDFLDDVLRAFRAAPIRAMLEYARGEGLTGTVAILGPAGEVAVPCDPSDALAVARRTDIPIYVHPDVFSEVRQFAAPPPAADEGGELTRWLERISPADFSTDAGRDRPRP